MTYVVTEDCIKCKYMDCVEVCPVDCFYEGDNMLVIHPDECIDCGVCEPECPPEAIVPDSNAKAEKWLKVNADFAVKWPNITRKGTAPADADEHKGEADKYSKYFSPEPDKGEKRPSWDKLLRFIPLCIALAGCASVDGYNLRPGDSTVHDVEMVMGQPADKRAGPDGQTIYWYPQLPYGRASYAARIGQDGTLLAIEQRLVEENIRQVAIGWSAEQVYDLLGPPYWPETYPRME